MIYSYVAGGVVLNKNNNQVVIVKQTNGTFTLPKGHVEAGEDTMNTAKREILEETGIKDLEFVRKLGSYQRHTLDQSGKENPNELKTITLFLFYTFETEFKPQDEDIPSWCHLEDVENKLTYEKDKEFFSIIKGKLGPERRIRTFVA